MLTDGEGNVLATDEDGSTIAKLQTVRARCWTPTATLSCLGTPRATWWTNGEGNVLAADEKDNTIVEVADSSGAVLGSNGNIFTAGDAECNVVLTDGEGIAVLVTEDSSAVAILP